MPRLIRHQLTSVNGDPVFVNRIVDMLANDYISMMLPYHLMNPFTQQQLEVSWNSMYIPYLAALPKAEMKWNLANSQRE
jgi:hypothetical protein